MLPMDQPLELELERPPKETARDVIAYEIQMLEYCYKELAKLKAPSSKRNAVLEAYLLHARILIEFFSDEPKHKDDDLKYFLDCTSWLGRPLTEEEKNKVRPVVAALREKWWNPLNKFLMHCTVKRYTVKRSWNVAAIHGSILELVKYYGEAVMAEPNTRGAQG
jgi:hypothetical protein